MPNNSDMAAIVEFANDRFYAAFSNGDLEEMADVWSTGDDIVCIHPGWPPLVGREEVMESWAELMQGGGGDIQCLGVRVVPQRDHFSVLCYEQLPNGFLIATNNFVIEGQAARMIHHQAGPCQPPDDLPSSHPIQ